MKKQIKMTGNFNKNILTTTISLNKRKGIGHDPLSKVTLHEIVFEAKISKVEKVFANMFDGKESLDDCLEFDCRNNYDDYIVWQFNRFEDLQKSKATEKHIKINYTMNTQGRKWDDVEVEMPNSFYNEKGDLVPYKKTIEAICDSYNYNSFGLDVQTYQAIRKAVEESGFTVEDSDFLFYAGYDEDDIEAELEDMFCKHFNLMESKYLSIEYGKNVFTVSFAKTNDEVDGNSLCELFHSLVH